MRLPDYSGVFLLDNFHGQPQLVEMQQSEGDIDRDTKANILRGVIPMRRRQAERRNRRRTRRRARPRRRALHLHQCRGWLRNAAAQRSNFVRQLSQPSLDAPRPEQQGSARQGPQQPQQPEQAIVPFDRFRIVHTKVKSGKRIVGELKRAPNGKISQDQNFVKTTIDRVSGGWLKLTPTEDLAPGEYVLIETKGNEGMNLYVWDFNVNPTAPANANPWKPDAKPAEPEKK